MSPRPKISEQHPHLEEAIKETAWRQIAENGASAMSLRAIARELGITAPAIYNYFPRRDDLVTELIVEAYLSLAQAQAHALAEIPDGDHVARLAALGHAYRQWALSHPERYNLIFGTPIPGYHAPMDVTRPAAAQSMKILIQTLDAAYQDGKLAVTKLPEPLLQMMQPWIDKFEYTGHPSVIYFALAIWGEIHGLVSLELFGHFDVDSGKGATDALFAAEIDAIAARIGIQN